MKRIWNDLRPCVIIDGLVQEKRNPSALAIFLALTYRICVYTNITYLLR